MTLFEPRESEPTGSRRRGNGWLVAVIVSGLLAILVAFGVIPLPAPLAAVFPPRPMGVPMTLEPDVAAVADKMYLTEEGRRVFTESRPRLADAVEVAESCGGSGFHGCYSSNDSTRSFDTIVIYQPTPGRVDASVVTTATHELLHAAYRRLNDAERSRVDAQLDLELLRVADDDPVHTQIAGSLQDDESGRSSELFAYLGTQFYPEGGLAPALEDVYARFISDRMALVRVYTD